MPQPTNAGRGILAYLLGPDEQPFDDSWRDQWSMAVGNQAHGILGADPRRTASTTRRLIDFVPFVGDTLSLNDAKRDYDQGNYGSAALNAGTGILGLAPGAGDAAVLGGKGLLAAMGAGVAKTGILDEATKGIRAYHGSPHSFDKFSMDKIGTGEGAQAYGHGLYFAEHEGVAKGYRDALSGEPKIDGESAFADMPWMSRSSKGVAAGALQTALSKGKTGDDAIREAAETLDRLAKSSSNPQPYNDAVNGMYSLIGKEWHSTPGHMYEVNINADPDAFLDWDRPLSEQSEFVRNALSNENVPPIRSMLGGMRGKSYSDASVHPYFKGSDLAQEVDAQALNRAGIPGIKYLDQGSRGAGEGSRNYVVFDENLISIVKKYGLAGAVSAGLISQQMADQMQAQGEI